MTKQELTYWVTLALMPNVWTRRKNDLYVNCFNHQPSWTIIDLFESHSVQEAIGMTTEEREIFKTSRQLLANHSFLVEDLLAQGYEIYPIHSEGYPRVLKENLGITAPTVIFTKGNAALLQAPSVAIVGSRRADDISLEFTDHVARRVAAAGQVVVSGFARGVDKQALDSALSVGGRSIIVLPQGIQTFASGFRDYYKPIAQGRVLAMSTFAPTAPWSKEFAMARNPIIYGMASEIYVAQSDAQGGTWSGAIAGLRKKRPVKVRWPERGEQNANRLLVQKGGQPVDIDGNLLLLSEEETKSPEQLERERLHQTILNLLIHAVSLSSQDILTRVNIDWSDARMKKFLDSMEEVERLKVKNRVMFRLKGHQEPSLF